MKNIKKVLAISVTIILLIIYLYTLSIQSIPDNIVIFEGEKINLKTILGLKADLTEKDQVIETLSSNQTKTIENPGKKVVKLSLFENIFLKNDTIFCANTPPVVKVVIANIIIAILRIPKLFLLTL